MSLAHSTFRIDSHSDPPDAFLGESRCFICNRPTTGSLYCSEDCKNADATALSVGPLHHHHHGCLVSSSSENCGSSASSSNADFLCDLASEPCLHRHGFRKTTRQSFSSMATSSESTSPISSPPSLCDDQVLPSLPDIPPPRSPFPMHAYPSPHAQGAANGLPTPPVLVLDGAPSPSLPPLLRYARRAFNTNVRASNTVSSQHHRRTPSGNVLVDHRLPTAESAPSSAVASPELSAKSQKSQANTTVRKKTNNRRSLPMCFGALDSPPEVGAPSASGVRSSIPATARDPPGADPVPLTSNMVISPSVVLGGDTASWRSGGSFHGEQTGTPDSATPTSLVTAKLQSLAFHRDHLRVPSPPVCVPSHQWIEDGDMPPGDAISESMSAFSPMTWTPIQGPPVLLAQHITITTIQRSHLRHRGPQVLIVVVMRTHAWRSSAVRLRERGQNATMLRRASSPGRRNRTIRALMKMMNRPQDLLMADLEGGRKVDHKNLQIVIESSKKIGPGETQLFSTIASRRATMNHAVVDPVLAKRSTPPVVAAQLIRDSKWLFP
ncbi:hypothetical protein BS47DRAFT_873941 [Hydnum rufescens UP504]|uniref:Uncharacterized protein n=1 Tax=Hydnum rufescens UP504 TaxID=1448309 RepID=A0A9P6AYR0_9AGAM|nr:hypothetical protein BS47DRAFT_873941 [Hydnum rufescens UP504]